MVRDFLKRAAKRLIAGAPRIPGAPPTTREPPTSRADWTGAPAPAAPTPEAAHPHEEEPEVEARATTVGEWLRAGRQPLFVDIREPHEVRQGYVAGALLLPMNDVPANLNLLPRDRPLILYCAAGMRSFGVAHYLRDHGFPDAWSLPGGIGAWLETGAPSLQSPLGAPFAILDRVSLHGEPGLVLGLSEAASAWTATVRTGSVTHEAVPVEELQRPHAR